jgi:hypothetical protein
MAGPGAVVIRGLVLVPIGEQFHPYRLRRPGLLQEPGPVEGVPVGLRRR